MTDTRETDCSETSCKDDLMQGLMALFAQADAAEAERTTHLPRNDCVQYNTFLASTKDDICL